MLPQEHINWLIQQPDKVLSTWKVRMERNGLEYQSITVDHKSTVAFTEKVIGRCLTRNLDYIQGDVYAEIKSSVSDIFGTSTTSWRFIDAQQSMAQIADRTATRAMFGLTLCRDQAYLLHLSRFKILMGVGTLVIGQLPPLIRPAVGYLINAPLTYYKWKVMRTLIPLIESQMREFKRRERDGTVQEEGSDFLTQSIRVAMTSKSFATLSSLGIVCLNVMLDILSTAPALKIYETIRAEALQVFASEASWTDPAALQNLKLPASAVRESLRKNPIIVRGLLREVMPQDGVLLPDGSHIAKGTWIGVPTQAIHMDERFYTNPDSYDPFRFAREQEAKDPAGKERFDATQPTDTFLGFSYGRHSCPGRWFANQILKLLIAYITVHYDIEPFDKRPEGMVFGDTNIPSLSAKLKVRRREDPYKRN
ncbi:hypothetical protein P7C71_g4417, partial [Lecanoromycetidae sp. Uapishka_2]